MAKKKPGKPGEILVKGFHKAPSQKTYDKKMKKAGKELDLGYRKKGKKPKIMKIK